MDFNLLKKLSWELKQKFAAKCLEKYCEKYKINDNSINELVEHLYTMEKYRNEYYDLATWESNGTELELTGRGDPLPEKLEKKIPEDKIKEFNEILEYTVEVGLCDMYGALTEEPFEFLMKCIKILEINSIELPNEIINFVEGK